MPGHMKTWSPDSKGEKYPDDGHWDISCLQNSEVIRIRGFKELWFGDVGVVRVVLEVINAHCRARLQKDVDRVNRGVIIGAQDASASGLEAKGFPYRRI
jgi:hypothetical protein